MRFIAIFLSVFPVMKMVKPFPVWHLFTPKMRENWLLNGVRTFVTAAQNVKTNNKIFKLKYRV